MNRTAQIIARLIWLIWRVYGKKWSFLALFLLMLFGSVGVLAALDLLPEPAVASGKDGSVSDSSGATTSLVVLPPEEPVKIEIPAITLETVISNPTTTNVGVLDAWLLKGAVRYPTSAKLGEDGNVVIFGHSSYLPVVHNPAYKAFNAIQKLKSGDIIIVSSSLRAYTYKVRLVTKENATQGAIPLGVEGSVLTLATCNSFATKDDRFIVTADFVESHPLAR